MKIIDNFRLLARAIRSASCNARREPSEPSKATAILRFIGSLISRNDSFAINSHFGTGCFGNKEPLSDQCRDHSTENHDCDQHRILTLRDDLILQAEQG